MSASFAWERVTRDEMQDVLALLHERSAWLFAKGIDQWQPPYPAERFARDVEAGTVWCWKVAEQVVATVTRSPLRPDYYPDEIWVDGLPSWYVSRLAVGPHAAGRSVGTSVLARIAADAAHAGVRALRLDVRASNPFLARYYAACGYRDVHRGLVLGEPSLFLENSLTNPRRGSEDARR